MKYCTNCGVELDDDALFCTSCGTKQTTPNLCPHCGCKHESEAAFCTNCGKRLYTVPAIEVQLASGIVSEDSTISTSISTSESAKKAKSKIGALVFIVLFIIATAGIGCYFFCERLPFLLDYSENVITQEQLAQVQDSTVQGQPTQSVNEPVEIEHFFEKVYSGDDYYEAVKSMVENNFSPEAQQYLRDLNDYEGQDDYAIWKIDGSSDGGCPSDKMTGYVYGTELKTKLMRLTFEMYDVDGTVDGTYYINYHCHYDHETRKVIIDTFDIEDTTL